MFDPVVEEERSALAARLRAQADQGHTVSHHETAVHHRNGQRVDVEIGVTSLRVGGHADPVNVARDISARKQAEAALRRSEDRFRSLVQNNSDLMTILGADGTILWHGPSVERVLGYPPDTLTDTTCTTSSTRTTRPTSRPRSAPAPRMPPPRPPSTSAVGTGSLRRLPVRSLKLDPSFLGQLDPESVGMLRAVATLAHTLGLEVAAEGVETDEQLVRLREADLDRGQGYLFSRPLAEDAMRKLLKKGSSLIH